MTKDLKKKSGMSDELKSTLKIVLVALFMMLVFFGIFKISERTEKMHSHDGGPAHID